MHSIGEDTSKKYFNKPERDHLPFCSAVKAGDYIFVSGTAALTDDEGNKLTNIESQTHQITRRGGPGLAVGSPDHRFRRRPAVPGFQQYEAHQPGHSSR